VAIPRGFFAHVASKFNSAASGSEHHCPPQCGEPEKDPPLQERALETVRGPANCSLPRAAFHKQEELALGHLCRPLTVVDEFPAKREEPRGYFVFRVSIRYPIGFDKGDYRT
jgi:hypothetical protein